MNKESPHSTFVLKSSVLFSGGVLLSLVSYILVDRHSAYESYTLSSTLHTFFSLLPFFSYVMMYLRDIFISARVEQPHLFQQLHRVFFFFLCGCPIQSSVDGHRLFLVFCITNCAVVDLLVPNCGHTCASTSVIQNPARGISRLRWHAHFKFG